MTVDDAEFRVKTGDAFRVEPGEVHNIINDTDQPIEAVFIKGTYDLKDKVDD